MRDGIEEGLNGHRVSGGGRGKGGGRFESRSGGTLLALRLGLLHASHLCEPLGPVLKRRVSATFVTVEEWGVTRHTSMSDMSEQLAGRPRIWSNLMPPICSLSTGPDCFN